MKKKKTKLPLKLPRVPDDYKVKFGEKDGRLGIMGYKWTCPYCGKEGLAWTEDQADKNYTKHFLKCYKGQK